MTYQNISCEKKQQDLISELMYHLENWHAVFHVKFNSAQTNINPDFVTDILQDLMIW